MKAYNSLENGEKDWVGRSLVKNKAGERVEFDDPEAHFFCLYYLVVICYPTEEDRYDSLRRIARVECVREFFKIFSQKEISDLSKFDLVNGVLLWDYDPEVTKEKILEVLKEAQV
jgi:hypothetical protein